MWHMHNVLIQISLGHLPLRTEEPCAGSTRQRCLQNKKMSGDHKVTVVFYGLTPAGGRLLFNHWSMGETGERNDLDWWDDAVQVCENCGTVHGGAWVHLVLICSFAASFFFLSTDERGAVGCAGVKEHCGT